MFAWHFDERQNEITGAGGPVAARGSFNLATLGSTTGVSSQSLRWGCNVAAGITPANLSTLGQAPNNATSNALACEEFGLGGEHAPVIAMQKHQKKIIASSFPKQQR